MDGRRSMLPLEIRDFPGFRYNDTLDTDRGLEGGDHRAGKPAGA
jgi:hypothetical protein